VEPTGQRGYLSEPPLPANSLAVLVPIFQAASLGNISADST